MAPDRFRSSSLLVIAAALASAPATADDASVARGNLEPKVALDVPMSGLAVAPMVAAQGLARLRNVSPGLSLGLEASYAQPQTANRAGAPTNVVASGGVGYQLALTEFAATVLGHYQTAFGPPRMSVHAFAGITLGGLWATLRAGDSTYRQSQFAAGFELGGGAGYRLGPGDVTLELRFRYLGAAMQLTGVANASGVSLAAGYRFSL